MKKIAFTILAISLVLVFLSGCPEPPAVCGNETLEEGEECELPEDCEQIEGAEVSCEECKCVYSELPAEPLCGNAILEEGEECEVAEDCKEVEGKIASCVECACDYFKPVPPSQPVCGNEIIEANEECDPPGSTCVDGGTCGDDCLCYYAYDEIECPPDKSVPWVEYCLPGLGAGVTGKFYNEDGTAGWEACVPMTLSQAHDLGECEDVQTVDPACDDWEGCNASECHITNCDHDTIQCTAHYHYVLTNGFCKAEITYDCEAECNCVEDEDATYILCPDPNCEAGCPFISAPASGTQET